MLKMDFELNGSAPDNLRRELDEAHKEIRSQDIEIARLNQIRRDLEQEIEELSAKLFEEAYRMVNDAQAKQSHAEKCANEQSLKVEVLSAEVEALKLMVLTSTPSQPNFHLYPHINRQTGAGKKSTFFAFHRRSPSHCDLLYGRRGLETNGDVVDSDKLSSSPSKNNGEQPVSCSLDMETLRNQTECEFDPIRFNEFLVWIEKPKTVSLLLPAHDLDSKSPFLKRIYCDDVYPCLRFADESLNRKITQAIENGTIFIEPIAEQSSPQSLLRVCSLLNIPSVCPYRMKIDGNDPWCDISLFSRNRKYMNDMNRCVDYVTLPLVRCSSVIATAAAAADYVAVIALCQVPTINFCPKHVSRVIGAPVNDNRLKNW